MLNHLVESVSTSPQIFLQQIFLTQGPIWAGINNHMLIHDIICELFRAEPARTQHVNSWEWRYRNDNFAQALFKVGSIVYMFNATNDDEGGDTGDWSIEFQTMKKVKGISGFGETGTGNEVEVFNTVIDIIKTLISDLGNRVQRLNFSAATSRRKSLYARMAHRLLPNWQLDQYGDYFTLTRPQPQEQPVDEDWNAVNRHDHTDGLSKGAVNAYRREHPGSKLQTAVTTDPSKLKPGSKAAKRRKSFCSRMTGNKGPMEKNGKPTPKALALRRWNC